MVAHILPNNIVPEPAQLLAIGLAAAGSVGVLRRRGALLDRVSWTLFGMGTAAIVILVGIAMIAPQPPGYSLSLALSPRSSSPVLVSVCARYPSGAAARTPENGDVLTYMVDGKQVGYSSISEFMVKMTPGLHTLRAELLAGNHREFNPRVAAQTKVTVTSEGVTASNPVPCPSG